MRRPSDTKVSLAQLDLTFFTDRDLGKAFPRILREGGLRVETYADHFSRNDIPDNQWLRVVASRGWIAVSHDNNIRSDAEAVRTLMENRGRLFIVRGKLSFPLLARVFLEAERSIVRLVQEQREAFIANVRRVSSHTGQSHATAELRLSHAAWSGRFSHRFP